MRLALVIISVHSARHDCELAQKEQYLQLVAQRQVGVALSCAPVVVANKHAINLAALMLDAR